MKAVGKNAAQQAIDVLLEFLNLNGKITQTRCDKVAIAALDREYYLSLFISRYVPDSPNIKCLPPHTPL